MKQVIIGLLTAMAVAVPGFAQDADTAAIVSSHGRVQIAAQPDAAEIQSWIDAGTTLVISVRTEREMNELAFNEAELFGQAGVTYVNIPMGYELGYSPDATSAIAELLAVHDGPVVIHCTIGFRAAHAYAASLIETGQLDPVEANELALSPRGDLDPDTMRSLSPRYAAAFPAE